MNFDKFMKIIKEEIVSDGMGGYEVVGSYSMGTIATFTTPVTAEVLLKEHGIVSTRALKIFTREYIPNEHVQLEYLDKRYEILQLADYGKFRMALIQEIADNE